MHRYIYSKNNNECNLKHLKGERMVRSSARVERRGELKTQMNVVKAEMETGKKSALKQTKGVY